MQPDHEKLNAQSEEQLDEQMDALADRFAQLLRSGAKPSVEAFVSELPQRANELRGLLHSILLLEGIKSNASHNEATGQSSPLKPNELIDDYRVLREIGRGGMGIVYEALHVTLGRRVAIKVFNPGLLGDPKHLNRFRVEARAAAKLRHSNIVTVFGVGHSADHHYYVMDFIDGESLAGRIRRLAYGSSNGSKTRGDNNRQALTLPSNTTNPSELTAKDNASGPPELNTPEIICSEKPNITRDFESEERILNPQDNPRAYYRWATEITAKIADGIGYAHQRGVLHRDIKPANLLIDSQSQVWIADFGLAKLLEQQDLTKTGDVLGTPQYMPPESFEGQYDFQSEVYTLGLTLFELLTLRPAIDGTTPAETIKLAMKGPQVRPAQLDSAIPRDLDTIVAKATASLPADRYASMTNFQRDLHNFLHDLPIQARPIGLLDRAFRWSRREPMLAMLTFCTFLLMAALTIVSSFGYLITNRSLERAKTARNRVEEKQLQLTNALDDKGRLLNKVELESQRAEQTLERALQAFEQLMKNAASRTLQGDPDLFGESTDRIAANVNPKDAEQLQILLEFFNDLSQLSNEALLPESARAASLAAEVYMNLGMLSESEKSYRLALSFYRRLSIQSPTPEIKLQLASVGNSLLAIAKTRGKPVEASGLFKQIITALKSEIDVSESQDSIDRVLLPIDAGMKFELARAYRLHASLGTRFEWHRRITPPLWRGNRARFRESRILDRATADVSDLELAISLLNELTDSEPAQRRYSLELARAYREKARILYRIDRDEDSRQSYSDALAIFARLVNKNHGPKGVLEYELILTLIRSQSESTRRSLGKALKSTESAEKLAAEYPDTPKYQALHAISLESAGQIAASIGNADSAIDLFSKARSEYTMLLGQDASNLIFEFRRALVAESLGELYYRSNQRALAEEVQTQSLAALTDAYDRSKRNRSSLSIRIGQLIERLRNKSENSERRRNIEKLPPE